MQPYQQPMAPPTGSTPQTHDIPNQMPNQPVPHNQSVPMMGQHQQPENYGFMYQQNHPYGQGQGQMPPPQQQAQGGGMQQQYQQQQMYGQMGGMGGANPGAPGGMPPPADPSNPAAQMSNDIRSQLNFRAESGESSVFFGNIPFNFPNEELLNLQQTVGSIRNMKMMQKDDNQPRGFGFCTYNDLDTATSAIRNLNKINVNGREIKVDYADDATNGTNLKREEVIARDNAEIISSIGGTAQSSLGMGTVLKPQKSTVNEMMQSLNDTQKEIMIFIIQDSLRHKMRESNTQDLYQCGEVKDMIDILTEDEKTLNQLEEIHEQVKKKLLMKGESNVYENHQGLWNMQPQQQQQQPMMNQYQSYQ